jgi:hypothetical protein
VALEVHGDDGVPFLLAGVRQHPVPDDTGVVHQDVQATEGVHRGLDQACRAVPLRDVGPARDGFAAHRGDFVDDLLRRAAAACG